MLTDPHLAAADAFRALLPHRGVRMARAASWLGAILLVSMLVRVIGADHQTPQGASVAARQMPTLPNAPVVEAGRSTTTGAEQ